MRLHQKCSWTLQPSSAHLPFMADSYTSPFAYAVLARRSWNLFCEQEDFIFFSQPPVLNVLPSSCCPWEEINAFEWPNPNVARGSLVAWLGRKWNIPWCLRCKEHTSWFQFPCAFKGLTYCAKWDYLVLRQLYRHKPWFLLLKYPIFLVPKVGLDQKQTSHLEKETLSNPSR